MESILSYTVPLSYLQAMEPINENFPIINNDNNNNNSNVNPPLYSLQPQGGINVSSSSLPPTLLPSTPNLVVPCTPQPSLPPPKKRISFTACAACQSKHCACDEQRYYYIFVIHSLHLNLHL